MILRNRRLNLFVLQISHLRIFLNMSKRSKLLVSMAQNMQTGTHSDQPEHELTLLQNVDWSESEKKHRSSGSFQNSNVNGCLSNDKFKEYPIFTEDGIELQEIGKDNSKPCVEIIQDVLLSQATALNTTHELQPVGIVNAGEFIRVDQSFSIKSSENPSNNYIELTFIDPENAKINSISNGNSTTLKDDKMNEVEPINIEGILFPNFLQ